MGFEDEVEQLRGLTVGLTIGPSGQANSPHPSSREGHLSMAWWNSSFSYCIWRPTPLIPLWLPGPAELGAINPYAVHDHGQPARQRHVAYRPL
jgi:hypothetical protein